MGIPSPTVLVLDDDPAIRDLMERRLRNYGYTPLTVKDFDEAAMVLDRSIVDAMIVDVRLGGGRTGLDLLRIIRAHPALVSTPVLVLTGANLSDAEESLITRMRAYLFRKPEGFDGLLNFLDTLTGRDQQH